MTAAPMTSRFETMSNKPSTKPTPTPPPPPPGDAERAALAAAEQAVADLEMQRRRQIEQQAEHDAERQAISYQAHVNHDTEARRRLSDLQDEAIRHTHALKDIDAGLTVAREKVALARAKLDRVLEQERREQIAAEFKKLVAVAQRLDELLAGFVAASRDATDIVGAIHGHGGVSPSREQFHGFGFRAIRTALAQTIWANRVERMAPNERITFMDVVTQWASRADSNEKDRAA
jgi:hypothetical protein